MARRTQKLTITDEGRDKGKTFVITEMPADQAERWAIRALLALTNSGADIPIEAYRGGWAHLISAGLDALNTLSYESIAPLLEEMWECVQYQHAPGIPLRSIAAGAGSDIEEVKTRIDLRIAVLRLHANFYKADDSSTTGLPPLPASA